MHNEKVSNDIMKLYEAIDTTVAHHRLYPDMPPRLNLPKSDKPNIGQIYPQRETLDKELSNEELHKQCIIAFKDLLKDMYPGDMKNKLPKIDWLINELQKKIGV